MTETKDDQGVEVLNKRFAILDKVGRPFVVGSDKIQISGVFEIMQLNSELLATTPDEREITLAASMTIDNKFAFNYVWMLMNGLLNNLQLPKLNLKDALIVEHWCNYFNIYQDNKDLVRLLSDLDDLIDDADSSDFDSDTKKILISKYTKLKVHCMAKPEDIYDHQNLNMYMRLLGIDSDRDTRLGYYYALDLQKIHNSSFDPPFDKTIEVIKEVTKISDVNVDSRWINMMNKWGLANLKGTYSKTAKNLLRRLHKELRLNLPNDLFISIMTD